ncbi:MAG: TRAP transporter small permease subunit [Rhizobiaceae bacterium]
MATSSSVLEDRSVLSVLDQKLHRLESVLALVSGIAIFSLMVLAVVSVGGRNTINQPLPGYVDWIEQIMPLIAFMGVAYTQRDGGHIRMDILVGKLEGRALWIAEFVTVFFMLVLMILLVWGSWSHFLRSFSFEAPYWSNDSSIDINLPIWPAKLLAPIAFFVLCLRLTIQLWGYGRAIANNSERPVAVPLVKDAATMAADEAQSVSGARGEEA